MAAFGAIAAAPTENGMDRPGGVYSYISTEDAAACAVACAQDKICLAWSFKATEFVGCSLKAIVPPQSADAQIESGIAPRASEFLSLTSLSRPAPVAPQPAPIAPPEKPRPVAAETPAPAEAAFEPIVSPAFASTTLAAVAPVFPNSPSLVRVSLNAAAPVEEEFAGASPDSFLNTAYLSAPQTISVFAPPPTRQIVLATSNLVQEEEFAGAAVESFLHIVSLAPSPARPTLTALPALMRSSLTQRDFVFEEEFEDAVPLARFTLVAAPAQAKIDAPAALVDPWLMTAPMLHAEAEEIVATPQTLAQMTIVPRPMMFAVAAEPAFLTDEAPASTQTAALEEDLLGGPDKP